MKTAGILIISWTLLAGAGLMQACVGSEGSNKERAAAGSRGCIAGLEWEGRAYVRRPMQPNAVTASGRLSKGAVRGCAGERANASGRQRAQVLRIKSVRPAVAVLVNGKPGIFVRPGYSCTGGSRYSSWRPLFCRPRDPSERPASKARSGKR
jgi:hypothetical protein